MAIDQLSKDAYKKRLKALRLLRGNKSQKEFAKALDIPPTRWSEYEGKGYPLPREVCYRIFFLLGEGFIEWIWFGIDKHLPDDFREDYLEYVRQDANEMHERNRIVHGLAKKKRQTRKRDSRTV